MKKPVSSLLTWNRFKILFWCFYYWLCISKFQLNWNHNQNTPRQKFSPDICLIQEIFLKQKLKSFFYYSTLRQKQLKCKRYQTKNSNINRCGLHPFWNIQKKKKLIYLNSWKSATSNIIKIENFDNVICLQKGIS